MSLRKMVHTKCRNAVYPLSNIQRFLLEDIQVPWSFNCLDYKPILYESASLKNKVWADPDIGDSKFTPKWNQIDGKINRISHNGDYAIVDSKPRNPQGRTGVAERGLLGRWGPNHAADPIVTRWKTLDGTKVISPVSKLPILQFCAIQRRDCDEWAIPGGMVDPGENISETLKREFFEEALNSLEKNIEEIQKDKDLISNFFKTGTEMFKGYVDDPRNTDNAWMETAAFNFHDDNGDSVGKFQLTAGDDAKNVRWIDIDRNLILYASHSIFIENVIKLRKAHW